MKKLFLIPATVFMIFSILSVSCGSKDDSTPSKEDDKGPKEKSKVTSFKFASTKKDCGITDGYANQQHLLPQLVHLNTDKCNGETFRPTITLKFSENPVPGTYSVVEKSASGKQLTVTSDQYNYTSWVGTAGTVVVTVNAEDTSKIDIELKSITMKNKTASDPKNPATDILMGFIIKI